MKPTFFASAEDFRRWLHEHHAEFDEFIVGFHKKDSGRGGLTYLEAVDVLLCFGWIDGVKRRLDEESYTHRVTPRRAGSTWSNVNVRNIERLTKAGLMHASGLAAFAARTAKRTGTYTYEKSERSLRPERLPAALERTFKKEKDAWEYWTSQPPGYRRTIVYWVTSAKQSVTREKRLARLIAESRKRRRVYG
ncbi:MAG TPA: YdeI/OmpD-associated family protein [Candidatus Didemnitutus sp.]|nr:YdeI/OmpD-associated family protein [Candidatus Didemnitutus sp.]